VDIAAAGQGGAAPGAAAGRGWRARLELGFERRADRTVLARQCHEGPLVVQRPFHPEGGVCHVYVVHPPGGVVAGDELQLQVAVGPQAAALVTTPAAGKFYRSAGPQASLRQSLEVQGGTLEWLPQENIYYPGAQARLATQVQLAGPARFFGWEIGCLGLAARGTPFDHGTVHQQLELRLDGRWLLCERQRLDAPMIAARWGLAGGDSIGTLLAYPADAALLEQARGVQAEGVTLAATLVEGLLVCRAIAAGSDRLRAAFAATWAALRPGWAGRPAHPPRVWAT
jgi:urease accessory protein